MRRFLCILLASLMILSLTACSAGEASDPWLEDLMARAEAGDTQAMKELGGYYAFPEEGREADYEKGIGWYQKASEALDVEATNTLGWFYEEGVGVAQDKAKADELYYKAWQIENGEYVSPEELAAQAAAIPEDRDWDWDAIYWGKASTEEYSAFHQWLNYCVGEGDAECTNILGDMYLNGLGVAADTGKAFELYKKAADMACPSAFTNLAYMYKNGTGVEKDALKAAEYFEQAITLGDAQAMAELGYLLFFGYYEIKSDPERGLDLCRQAAEAGNIDGIDNYAFTLMMHGRKHRNHEESEKALEYYLKAAELGLTEGWNWAGTLYTNGDLGYIDYAKAEECYMTGVELGFAPSMFEMCEMYLYGLGRPVDRVAAKEWLDKGLAVAKFSDITAQAFYFMNTGSGEPYDDEFNYHCAMYLHENFNYSYTLAICYDIGIFVEQDGDKYVEYMSLAHEQGNDSAAISLAQSYELGIFEYDLEKAAYWWLKSAELGVGEAMLKTGSYYEHGTAGEYDPEKAAYWYNQALEHGNKAEQEEAESKLNRMRAAGLIKQ